MLNKRPNLRSNQSTFSVSYALYAMELCDKSIQIKCKWKRKMLRKILSRSKCEMHLLKASQAIASSFLLQITNHKRFHNKVNHSRYFYWTELNWIKTANCYRVFAILCRYKTTTITKTKQLQQLQFAGV